MRFTKHTPIAMIATYPTEIAYIFSFSFDLADQYLVMLENVKEKNIENDTYK